MSSFHVSKGNRNFVIHVEKVFETSKQHKNNDESCLTCAERGGVVGVLVGPVVAGGVDGGETGAIEVVAGRAGERNVVELK